MTKKALRNKTKWGNFQKQMDFRFNSSISLKFLPKNEHIHNNDTNNLVPLSNHNNTTNSSLEMKSFLQHIQTRKKKLSAK